MTTGPARVRGVRWLIGGMLALAAIARIPYLDQAPYDFAPNRQHYSALIARAAYFSMAGERVEVSRKAVVDDYMQYTMRLDPAIAERAAALAYLLTGGERLWLARGLSSLYWLAGGLALFLAARRLTDELAGLAAAAVFLFLPWGLLASRSIQPDALAVMFVCVAIWGAATYEERPTRRRLLSTATAVSLAVLIRAPTACLLFPLAAAVLWRQGRLRALLTSRDALVFWSIALIPTVVYYVAVTVTRPEFATQAAGRLAPSMWLQTGYWQGWLRRIDLSVTMPVFVTSIAAALLARGRASVVVWSLWAGYLCYGLALPLWISSHTYYQTLVLPVLALSCGAATARLPVRLPGWMGTAVVGLVTVLCLGQAGNRGVFERRDDGARLEAFRDVGVLTGHSRRVVFLTDNFGVPLRYHGEVSGRAWPWRSEIAFYRDQGAAAIPELPAAERLATLSAELDGAEYFAITELAELNRQADLKSYLESHYPVIASGERFMVFDLRTR